MKQNKTNNDTVNLHELTKRLRSEDARYSGISKRFQIIYWILVPVYSILVIRLLLENAPFTEIAGSICYLMAMLVFALMFRNYSKEYQNVDYSQPTLIMLKQAALRYKPFQGKTLWALLAALLIDGGLSLHSWESSFMEIQIIFLGALFIGLAAGLILWSIRYKPLRKGALKLIKELEHN